MTKIVSWNVNGLRACVNKGFIEFFKEANADIFCVQEIKLQEGQIDLILEGYFQYWNYADKKGYSGTAVFTKEKPISFTTGMDEEMTDGEGRVLTLEYEDYYLVNVYSPNSRHELLRLSYRMQWEDDFREYLQELDKKKLVIICGDMNVAHEEIDLKNPKTNRKNPGFTDEERGRFTQLLDSGFTDSFRYLYPEATDKYTWWSYRFNARTNNAGWRIDYFCVSKRLEKKIVDFIIYDKIMGSDHCPIEIEFK